MSENKNELKLNVNLTARVQFSGISSFLFLLFFMHYLLPYVLCILYILYYCYSFCILYYLCITVYVLLIVYVTLPPGIGSIAVGNKYIFFYLQFESAIIIYIP
jgi:hypothetical protein